VNVERGIKRTSIFLAAAWVAIWLIWLAIEWDNIGKRGVPLMPMVVMFVAAPTGIVGLGHLAAWAVRGFREAS
jgi:hypothetical protein